MSFDDDHVFHQIVPVDTDADAADAAIAEGFNQHTLISSQHTVVSSTTGQVSSSEDDVIERLVKEIQAQSPSIYTSVKNLIAYLVGTVMLYTALHALLHCTTLYCATFTLCRKRVVVRNL